MWILWLRDNAGKCAQLVELKTAFPPTRSCLRILTEELSLKFLKILASIWLCHVFELWRHSVYIECWGQAWLLDFQSCYSVMGCLGYWALFAGWVSFIKMLCSSPQHWFATCGLDSNGAGHAWLVAFLSPV